MLNILAPAQKGHSAMTYETIIFEQKDAVSTIRLNRPDKLNALSGLMGFELEEVLERCESDESVRAVVLTGMGRGFCSGADISRDRAQDGQRSYGPTDKGGGLIDRLNRCVLILRRMEKPVIGSINGVAVGAGCNIALATDIRIASDKARFSEIFANIGLIPDCGGCFFLPWLVGIGKASELVFTAEIIDAAEALRIGLVNRVVPHDELQSATEDFVARLARGPTKAFGYAKKVMNAALSSDLETVLKMEAEHQAKAAATEDAREGPLAFAEKRKPNFKGR